MNDVHHVARRGLAAALLAVGTVPLLAGQQLVFRDRAHVVALHATVRDGDGHFVPDLTRDDFQVFDNDQPRSILVFENRIEPIAVAILRDDSASLRGFKKLEDEAIVAFVDALLPGDRIRVGAFADSAMMSPRWTSDRAEAIDQLKALRPRGEMTAVDGAIQTGGAALEGQPERQVLLIVSDGAFAPVPTRASLVPERVTVFFVGIARKVNEPLDRYLKNAFLFSEAAGGGHRLLRPGDDLVVMFKQVAEELHHRYLLGFPPVALDGKEHRIRVRLTKPGLTARAGTYYLAADR